MRTIIICCAVGSFLCSANSQSADSAVKTIPSTNNIKRIAPAPAPKVNLNSVNRQVSVPKPAPVVKPVTPSASIPARKIPTSKVKTPVRKPPTFSKDNKTPTKKVVAPIRKPSTASTGRTKVPASKSIQSLGKKNLAPPFQTSLPKSIQPLGSAGKDLGRRKDFGALPGHNASAGGIGSSINSGLGRDKLGNTSGIASPMDNLNQPVQVIGRGSTRQSQEEGEVLYRGDGKVVDKREKGTTYVVPGDDFNLLEVEGTPLTEEEEVKAIADEERRLKAENKAAEEKAFEEKLIIQKAQRQCGYDPANCDQYVDEANKKILKNKTTVADDEPDGEGAGAGDVTLSDNGSDTTGGVNEGNEQEVAGGTARQRYGPGSQISDFDPNVINIKAEDLNSLNVIIDATGGGIRTDNPVRD